MPRNEQRRPVAWILLEPGVVPLPWAGRARPLVLIPVDPDEVTALLRDEAVTPHMDADEHRLASLVAQGRTTVAIARALGVSRSTVQRRLAELRARLGVGTQAELALTLARQGFGMTPEASSGEAGSTG